jgi:hypothetical protein
MVLGAREAGGDAILVDAVEGGPRPPRKRSNNVSTRTFPDRITEDTYTHLAWHGSQPPARGIQEGRPGADVVE